MHLKLIITELEKLSPEQRELQSLQYLLNRSTSEPIISNENLLSKWFGINTPELPIAAITGLGDGLATQTGYWLRADPVQLQADLTTAYLVNNQELSLQLEEMKQLVADINSLIATDHLILMAPHTTRWYLKSSQPVQIKTYPLQQVFNKNINSYLPTGEHSNYWRRLFTEIQMLLHAHPINQKRQARGLPMVNGVWFWGEGQLPSTKTGAWQHIWCYDDPLLKGLGYLANCTVTPLPDSFAQIAKQFKKDGDYLLQISALQIANLENNWLQPLWQALRKKRLQEFTLFIGTDKIFRMTAKNIRYFWKKRHLVNYYLDYEKKDNASSI